MACSGGILASESGYESARLDTINPLTMTPENAAGLLKNGEQLYASMCMHCHGEKGDGNGTMIQSGAYGDLGVVPAYKSLDTLSEGKNISQYLLRKRLHGCSWVPT